MQVSELRKRRVGAKISRKELADHTTYSAAMIQRIEEGRKSMPEGYVTECLLAIALIAQRRASEAAQNLPVAAGVA